MNWLGFDIAPWKYDFTNPTALWLLLSIPLLLLWFLFYGRKRLTKVQFSSIQLLQNSPKSSYAFFRYFIFSIKIIGIGFLILGLARPKHPFGEKSYHEESKLGIDIMIAMDASGSMRAMDFKPNRLQAAKELAKEFIDQRKNDRIGLVVYEGESYTQCPLTTDHAVLKKLFTEVKTGVVKSGTAVGLGLARAVARIKDSEAISKVVILMTDGVSNMGSITPVSAAQLAEKFNVRVYTIGVGTNGMANMPFEDQFGRKIIQQVPVEIDESILKTIASKTGGKYFRATSNSKLREIYQEIDRLEKTKIDVIEYEKDLPERFFPFLLSGAILLLLSLLIDKLIFRRIS